jgi:hypothetical protein
MKTLLISPHNDDETLFCSHAISRYDADLLVVYDSYVQIKRDEQLPLEQRRYPLGAALRPDLLTRRKETIDAYFRLTGADVGRKLTIRFAALNDACGYSEKQVAGAIRLALGPAWSYDRIFAPAIEEGGHDQHNVVGAAAAMLRPFGCSTCRFGDDNTLPSCPMCGLEYDPLRKGPELVRYLTYTRQAGKSTFGLAIELSAEETFRKLQALACYRSQIDREDCRPHFLRQQGEYIDAR